MSNRQFCIVVDGKQIVLMDGDKKIHIIFVSGDEAIDSLACRTLHCPVIVFIVSSSSVIIPAVMAANIMPTSLI